MIKIALEVSTVGLGQLRDSSGKDRTGIYRVTTELAGALLRNQNISVFLLFWAYPQGSDLGMEYFKKKELKANVLFQNSILESKIYQTIYDRKGIPNQFAVMRVTSKLFQYCKFPSMPKHIDVYHSLYYPLPEFINPKHYVRFRTIHDITPILFPGYFSKRHRKKFIKDILKCSFKNDWFFAVSSSTKNDFCDCFSVPAERVFVNHLAASSSKFYPEKNKTLISHVKKTNKIPPGDYFLSVATLEPRKNLQFVLNCFKKIILSRDIEKDCYLVLVGRKGWLISDMLNEFYSDPTLKSRVIMTGFIEDQFLSPLYSGALAFLYPSLYEGFGLPALEAMQCGAPVITSNTSSLPEVVGDAGILIDPTNEDEMCEAMIEITKNKNLRNMLSAKGIERAALFSWDKVAARTIEAYRFAMDNKGY